jgi:N-acetyl-gamma-glutamyl-phosphate reductase
MQQEAQEPSYPSETHFSWRSNNMSHYKAFEHQHLGEINQSVHQLQADYTNELILYPTEVILPEEYSPHYTQQSKKVWKIVAKYETYYQDQPFVTVTTQEST